MARGAGGWRLEAGGWWLAGRLYSAHADLNLLAPDWPRDGAAQPAASGTIVTADDIAATLKQSIANNVVDQPIKLADVPGGHKASVALLRRTKAETSALIHNRVTEIYQIVEGAGTIVTGGSLENATPTDLTRVNAGPSQTGTHKGGESRRVGPKDVIIVPAGMAHRFSQLDGAIVYMVYRFEPRQQ